MPAPPRAQDAPPPLHAGLGALVTLLLLAVTFASVCFSDRTLRNGPGMPGVVPTGVYGVPSTLTPEHTMDMVPAFIDEPLTVVMARQIRDGHAPLWNPDNGCGAPLLGNMQSAPLSPFRWPALLFPHVPWVYDVQLLLRLFCAGWFMWLWLRSRGLSRLAAATGDAAFMLCGYFVLHVTMHHLSIEVLLPALLLFLDRVGQRGGAGNVAGLALVAAGTIVGGNPEATIVLWLFAAAYALVHARASGRPRLLLQGATMLVAAGLSAPYLLTGAEYLQNSAHHHAGVSAGLDHYRPWMALGYLSRHAFTDGVHGMVPPYLGTATVALAIVGLLAAPRGLPWRLLAGAASVTLAKALGLPLLDWLGQLPVLDVLYFYKYGNPVIALCVAALAAGGVAALQDARPPARALVAPALVLAALVGLAAWARARHAALDAATAALVSVRVPWAEVALATALALVLGGTALVARGRWPATAVAAIAAAAAIGELIVRAPSTRPPRLDAFVPAPYVDVLRAAAPSRSFGFEDALPPNVNAALGLPDVRSHDGLYARRFERFLREFLNPNNHSPQFDGRLLYPLPAATIATMKQFSSYYVRRGLDAIIDERNSFTMDFTDDQKMRGYDLASVRHVLFNPTLIAGADAFCAARPNRWRHAYPAPGATGEMVVLENRQALPRAYLVAAARSAASEDDAVARLRDPALPIARTVVVEAPAAGLPTELPPDAPDVRAQPRCHVAALTADAVRIAIDQPADGFVVLTDTFFPGWIATVDGAPAPIVPANVMFRAVRVTAQARSVVLRYAPVSWRLGVWLAAASSLVLLGLCHVARRPTLRGVRPIPQPPSKEDAHHGQGR